MSMTREELISTALKITELRAEVARLSGLQKDLRRLEAVVDEITGAPASARPDRGTESIGERVWKLLEADGNHVRDWSAEEVSEILQTKVPTTRAAFSKLRKANRIVDTKRGRVRAAIAEELTPEPQEEDLSTAA